VVSTGQIPLIGSAVSLYLAGSPATLITSGTTDSTGTFKLAFSCSTAPLTAKGLLYLIAQGGSTGTGSNAAIMLETALGQCQALPATASVDELTTVASAYALNAFHGSSGIGGDGPGLAPAFATVAALADPKSGGPASSLPTTAACSSKTPPVNCIAVERLSSLGSALAACDRTPVAGSQQCAALLGCAVSGASFDAGTGLCTLPKGAALPENTLQAVLAIARNPGISAIEGIYQLSTASAVFSPALTSLPTDWTLSLNFTGGGLGEPTGTAIDGSGNVWVANYNSAVTELSPSGAAISPGTGYTGGGLLESFGIAIDGDGNAWVANEQSGGVNSGLGSVTELSSTGAVLSGTGGYFAGGVYFPEAVAIDKSGHVWIANYGNSTLSELQGSSGASPGAALSPASGDTGGGLSFPQAIATDDGGNVWVANTGANQLSEFSSTAQALSPPGGFSGGGLDVPQAIAIDQNGDVWAANFFGDSVSVFNGSGAPLKTTAISGGGLQAPGGIAIDGAGNAWVTNFRGASLSEFASLGASAGGAPLSPATSGFTGAGLAQPFSAAIDSSGNIWIANFGNNSVTEFIGIAAPVRTPLIGTPQSP